MKTIARNRTAHIEKLFAAATDVVGHSQSSYYVGVPVSIDWVRQEYARFSRAKLYQDGPDAYRVRVNGQCWYQFKAVVA
jgi:hypothetical protein